MIQKNVFIFLLRLTTDLVCFIEDTGFHIPSDGNIYITDNTKYHTAINGGEEDRIHLVATLLN